MPCPRWILAACLGLTASVASAQNDPDIQIDAMGRSLDFAYASDTTLVAAYVLPGTPQDKIVVQTSLDRGAHWTQVYRGPLGGVQTLLQLSVDVASGFMTADH